MAAVFLYTRYLLIMQTCIYDMLYVYTSVSKKYVPPYGFFGTDEFRPLTSYDCLPYLQMVTRVPVPLDPSSAAISH